MQCAHVNAVSLQRSATPVSRQAAKTVLVFGCWICYTKACWYSSPALGGSLSQALASPKALGLCLWLMLAHMEPNPIGEHHLQLMGPFLRCLVHVAHRLKALLGARLHPNLLCASRSSPTGLSCRLVVPSRPTVLEGAPWPCLAASPQEVDAHIPCINQLLACV